MHIFIFVNCFFLILSRNAGAWFGSLSLWRLNGFSNSTFRFLLLLWAISSSTGFFFDSLWWSLLIQRLRIFDCCNNRFSIYKLILIILDLVRHFKINIFVLTRAWRHLKLILMRILILFPLLSWLNLHFVLKICFYL